MPDIFDQLNPQPLQGTKPTPSKGLKFNDSSAAGAPQGDQPQQPLAQTPSTGDIFDKINPPGTNDIFDQLNPGDEHYRQLYTQQKNQGLGDVAHGAWEGIKALGNMVTGSAKELGQTYGQAEAAAEQNPNPFAIAGSEPARKLRSTVLEGLAQTGRNYLNMVTKDVPSSEELASNFVSGGGTVAGAPGALLSSQIQHEINKPGGMVRNLLEKAGLIGTTPEQDEMEYQQWKRAQQDKDELAKTPAAPAFLQNIVSGGAEPLPQTTAAISMAADPLNYLSLGASPIAQSVRKVEAGAQVASAAERAASMAGNAMTKGGKALEAVGSLPEKAAEKITEMTLGPGAAESVQKAAGVLGSAAKLAGAHALGGPLEPVVAGLEAAKRAGQIAGKAGEVTTALADADRANPFGRLAAIAKDPDAPEWMRYAASSPLVKAVAPAIGAARDVAAGTLHGAGLGLALGSANADTPEELGQSAGQMAAFGGAARALTLPAQNRARVMQKMAGAAAELYHQNVSAGTSPETMRKVADSTMMNAASAQKAFGNVSIRFLDGENGQFAEQAKNSGASQGSAGFWDPSSKTIYLNADSGRGVDTTLLHELMHPLFDSVVANRPELKAQIDSSLQRTGKTLDQAKRDYVGQIVGEKGFTNRDDYDRAVQQYIDREDKGSAALHNDPNHWIYSELMAEAGMKAMKGKNLVTDIMDPSLSTRAVQATRDMLSKVVSVKFNEKSQGKTILPNFEDAITSPEIRKSVYSLMRAMKEHRPGIDEAEPQGVKVTPENLGQHPGAPVHVLPNGELGNDFMSQSASGKAVARPNKDIRKIVRNRRAEVNAAYPLPQTEAPTTQDPKLQWRKTPSGLSERSGTTLGADFDKLRTFNDDTKAKAHDLESAVANGEARQGWYQQVGEGPDWRGSVSRDTGNVTAQHKQFQPINFHVDKAGNVLVRNYSLGAMNDKAQMWAGRHGDLSLDLWDGNVKEFKDDVAKYLDNHKNGLSGDTGIGEAKKNAINAFLVGKNVTWEKANPLRSKMRGSDAQGVVRSYRLDRLETLAPHETEFAKPDYSKQVRNLSPDLKKPIEVTGPDGKKYKATYDGDQDFSAIGRGKVPQITMLEEAPGFVKHTTTYGPSLESKGYKFELPKAEEAPKVEAAPEVPPKADLVKKLQRGAKEQYGETPSGMPALSPDLTHWSQEEGLKTLDPKKHGTGLLGAEAKRLRDYPELYQPRTYFGTKGYEKEPGLGDQKYKAKVPAKALYDFESDPKDLYPGRDELEKAGYAPFDQRAATTLYEKKIKEAGYEGYVNKTAKVAAKFTPTDVTPAQSPDFKPKTKPTKDIPDRESPFHAWQDPDGNFYKVPSMGHAEWAGKQGTTSEQLFKEGWSRVMGYPGRENPAEDTYRGIYVDADKPMTKAQRSALEDLGFARKQAIVKGDNSKILIDSTKDFAPEYYGTPRHLPIMSPDVPREMPEDKELTRYASRIAALTEKNGGASFDVTSGKAPTKGFATSLYPDRTQFVEKGQPTPEAIKAFAQKNSDLLAQPDHVIGTWHDKESGKTYLDVSYIAPNENIAKHAADMFNQKAYWDVKGQKEVKAAGNGEPMENMPPALERVQQAKASFAKTQELPKGEIRGPVQAALPEGTDDSKGRVRTLQESQHLDLEAIKNAPDTETYRKKLVEQFRTQPGFRDIGASDTNKAIDEINSRVQKNLQFLYGRATPEDRNLWRQWYDFAHDMSHRWGKEYGVHGDVVAAINARLSPQMEWNNNVSLTRRALDTIKKDPTVTEADLEFLKAKITKEDTAENPQTQQSKNLMNRQLEALAGMKPGDKMSDLDVLQAGMLMRSHNELYAPRSPLHDHNLKRIPGDYLKWSKPFQDLADVVDIYRNPSFENVSNLLGGNHKVRSFYNNHVDPKSPLWTTIDTHATAAANLYPYGGSDKAVVSNFGNPNHKNSGVNGVYPVYQDAYEKVATKNGILPRELQSIIWEQMRKELNPAAKRMVQDAAKKAAEKGAVGPFEAIWAKAEKGEITREQAQKELVAEFEKWNSKANHGAAAKKRAATEASQEQQQEMVTAEEIERMRREFEASKKRGNEPLPSRPRKADEPNPTPINYRKQRVVDEPF